MSIFSILKTTAPLELARQQRFWARIIIDPTTECWIYPLRSDHYGYGRVRLKGKKEIAAHRYAYSIANNVSLDSLKNWLICHHCDTKACVNPEHLYKGTQQTNMHDIQSRNTERYKQQRSLTPEEVKQIRCLAKQGKSLYQLAIDFNVSGKMTISNIVNRKTWAWLTDD